MSGRRDIPVAWREPVAAFLERKGGEGLSAATVQSWRYRLERFARMVGGDPLEVTAEQVERVIQAERSAGSRKLLRLYAAAFFAWLQDSGRRDDNPTGTAARGAGREAAMLEGLPVAWREPVAAFLLHDGARVKPETLGVHRAQLCRFARRAGVSPLEVTAAQVRPFMEGNGKRRAALGVFFAWLQDSGRRDDNPAQAAGGAAPDTPTVEGLPVAWREPVAAFLEYKRAGNCSAATITTRYYQLKGHAARVDVSPLEVTAGQLVEALAVTGEGSRKGLRNCLATFYRWLHATGRRDDNPAEALPNVRDGKPKPKPCPDEYIAEAMRKATPSERLIIRLAAECGLRRGEIAKVHSADVIAGVRGGCSLIVHGKGGKQRTVPIADDMARTISEAGGYLFPGRFGGHVEESYISTHVSELLPAGYSAHKLRHRFATVAYTDSHDMLAVSEALGHSSTEVTRRYVALAADQLRPLVEAATIDKSDGKDAAAQDNGKTGKTTTPRSNGKNGKTDGKDGKDGKDANEPDGLTRAMLRMLLGDVLGLLDTGGVRSFRIHLNQYAQHAANVSRHKAKEKSDYRHAILESLAIAQTAGVIETITEDADTIGGNVTADAPAVRKLSRRYRR